MAIESYIDEAIFSENEKQKFLCRLFWDDLKETGYVITDESGHELDSIVKAVSIVNLIGEFRYRLYDEVNETGYEDVLEYLANLDIYEDEILDYCRKNENIETDEEFSNTAKNMLDYITETTADKLLEEFSADDIFDYMFCATYDFVQDFTFDFEDVDEFCAFVDAQSERLDEYKEEYPNVMNWILAGMVC